MKKRILKAAVLNMVCILAILVALPNLALAATPEDQSFDGNENLATGVNIIALDGIVYTTDNNNVSPNYMQVAGCGGFVTNQANANVPPYFSGNALTNDSGFSAAPTFLQMSSESLANNFKMSSMYYLATVYSGGSKIDIKGYDKDTSVTPVAAVTGIDVSQPSQVVGSGDKTVTFTRDINDTTNGEYGGLLTFGAGWTDIDTILITNNSAGNELYATVDSLDFSNVVDITVSDATVNEDAGTATFTITSSKAYTKPIMVDYATADDTATTAGDYTNTSGIATIPIGSTSVDITVPINNDTDYEQSESFYLNLTNPSVGGFTDAQGKCTINDNDSAPSVTLSVVGGSVSENGGTSSIVATLSNKSYQDVTVSLTYSGTATNGTDYTGASAIIIPAGSQSGSITLTSTDDAIYEGNETISIEISSVNFGTENGTQQAQVSITDNETQPLVTLSVGSTTFSENLGTAIVTANLSNASYQDVIITLGFTGSAVNGADYTATGTTITIPAGATSGSITLTSVDNGTYTGNKVVKVDITNVESGTESGTQQVEATIVEDETAPSVTLSISGSPLAENAGIATITATLSSLTSQDVTINLGYTGTATSGTDYTASANTITIPAGSTSGTVTITGVNDTVYEASENVVVDITSVVNAVESTEKQVTAIITDDEAVPTVTLSKDKVSISENAEMATITATLSNLSYQAVTVELVYTGNAVGAGTDYTASATTIVIPAGSLTGTATVTSKDNSAYEDVKNIFIDILSVTNGAENGTQQVGITITEDETQPSVTLSVAPAAFSENAGTATVTANLSNTSYQTVTVTLDFTGSAINATDYTATGTTITIPAGATSNSITLTGIDNGTYTGDRVVNVGITNVINGTESGTQLVTASIIEDETAPYVTLSISGSPLAENAGIATITATLSSLTSQAVTVNLGYAGTATSGTDYTASANTITIPAGSSSGTVTITGVNDTAYEASENIVVDITDVINAAESIPQQVTATITDDDAVPTVTLSTDKTSISENAEMATITATLSNLSYQAVTVELGFTGTAGSVGTNYTASGTIIVIPAGSLTGTVTVTSKDNSVYEDVKNISIDISNVTNGTENGTQQVQVTITDNETQPSVTLNVTPIAFTENGGTATITATLSSVSYQSVTVALGFTGVASSGTDYTASGTEIIIPAGSLSNSIVLTGIDNGTYTGARTVNIDITNVANATESGIQQVTATITDNETAPSVTLSTVGSTLAENGGTATITVTLSSPSSQQVIVNLGYTGTATSGTDYTTSANTIIIQPGSTSNTVTITGVNDTEYEVSENIVVDITSVTNAQETTEQQVTLAITDDETMPTVSLSTIESTFVKNGGTATITAALSYPSYQDVTVDLAFAGTAIIGTDYSASDSSIVISAGSLSDFITLTGINNTVTSSVYESDKTVIVSIANVTNAIKNGTQEKTLTITKGNAAPSANLSISSSTLAEAGGTATVTVTLSSVSTQDVLVEFDYTGTANSDDYTVSANSIFIPAGELTGSVTLTAKEDGIDEEDQTVIVTIANITGVTVSGRSQVVATIMDDDAVPEISINDPVVSKGSSNIVYIVTLSSQSEKTITVDYATASGSTLSVNGTLVFEPSDTIKTITAPVSSADNMAVVNLTNSTNAIIKKAQGTGMVVNVIEDDSETTDDSIPTPTPTPTGAYKAEVTSDNRDVNNITNVTTVDGIKTTTVIVDDVAIQANIKNMKNANKIVGIAVNNDSDVVEGILNGQTVSDMEEKDALLEIKTESVAYTIAAKAFNVDAISKALGENVALEDIKFDIKISKAAMDTVNIVEDTASKNSYKLVVNPVEFDITATAGNQSVGISRFRRYAQRTLVIPNGVDANKITTGVVLNRDGTFSHVPTKVTFSNGKYYAIINSLTNSVYTVIWNPITFKDVENHWSKTYVNEVGSRLIDGGTGAGNFSPDRAITRAEFATMIVKTLGLRGTGFVGKFNDVNESHSSYSYICTAYEYGIIAGYTNGNFGPEDLITREQAMTMMSKAMKIAGIDVNLSDTDSNNQLKQFKDAADISSYAKDAVSICTKNNVFNGNTNGELTPLDNFTRAESATVMIKLLKAAGLI